MMLKIKLMMIKTDRKKWAFKYDCQISTKKQLKYFVLCESLSHYND